MYQIYIVYQMIPLWYIKCNIFTKYIKYTISFPRQKGYMALYMGYILRMNWVHAAPQRMELVLIGLDLEPLSPFLYTTTKEPASAWVAHFLVWTPGASIWANLFNVIHLS